MSQSDADHAAATAVVAHHTQLAADLSRYVTALRAAARGTSPLWRRERQTVLEWLRAELLPHATAEEAALYPAAADQPGGRLLVDGMLAEHEAITALVAELDTADAAVDAAAAARALAAVFEVHLAKENNLILPLLLDAPQIDLSGLLAGMHTLLGAEDTPGRCGGGGCGCGGDRGQADAPAPVLSLDTRVDVRGLPHDDRHARVLAAVDALPADGALVLIAPHAPLPLLAEIEAQHPGELDIQWLQDGPDVWQIRLHRQSVTV
ncbi:DUF2249 domain-containing protein [Dactylosporangium sp. NBC_01737]|uniref:DUF2249 domain-containing protein n=1 Tax=Dactylosporangium sp. NBC_01737 TaxID=2975959 RepID=UPI002E13DF86|nr:DUF2249 domain-containing protein [Dactylosporangium sp. NBC_01737]